MRQAIIHVALVVRDYDEAIDFYCKKLHFTLVEDTYQPEQDKRWFVVSPPGSNGACLQLARASTPQEGALGGFASPLVDNAQLPGLHPNITRDRPWSKVKLCAKAVKDWPISWIIQTK